ncbi:MAG: hypothetical protein AB1894_29410 [Chloroflexota bacterium]
MKRPVEDFLAWLDGELALRGWNDFQLSQQAGVSHSMLSRARRGALPGWDGCEAIASALDVPAELVFRLAGLLPELPDEDGGFEQWRYLLVQLSEEDRQELLQIARLKLERQERRKARRARLGGALEEPA